MTFLVLIYLFVGMVALGVARIKVPHDTQDGKEHPDAAMIAWFMMIFAWPFTLINRKKFAIYGDPKDKNNPSWLSQS